MAQIGYIHAGKGESSVGQLEDVMLDARFAESRERKDPVRPVLRKCLGVLRRGDTLHVHSFDRLARDMRDLQALILSLTSAGVAVRFHKEKLIFQSREASVSQHLLFRILDAFADFERIMAHAEEGAFSLPGRTGSKRLGRPPKLNFQARQAIARRLAAGEDCSSLAEEYNVSLASIQKIRSRISFAEKCDVRSDSL